MQAGLEHTLAATYDGELEERSQAVKVFLQELYELPIFNHRPGYVSAGAERAIRQEAHTFFLNLFDDAIAVDKTAAIHHLHTCGYSLRHEVKGLSRALVEKITASNAEPADNHGTAIAVPAALWDGKTNPAVRDTLRENSYSDPVSKRVLLFI